MHSAIWHCITVVHSSKLTLKQREAPHKTSILYTGPSIRFYVDLGRVTFFAVPAQMIHARLQRSCVGPVIFANLRMRGCTAGGPSIDRLEQCWPLIAISPEGYCSVSRALDFLAVLSKPFLSIGILGSRSVGIQNWEFQKGALTWNPK